MFNSDFEKINYFVAATKRYCQDCNNFKQIDGEAERKAEQINSQIDSELERLKTLFNSNKLDESVEQAELQIIKTEIETLCAELVATYEPNKLLKFLGNLTGKLGKLGR